MMSNQFRRPSRRAFLGAAVASVVGLSGMVPAQQPGDPYRTVEPYDLPLDKPGIYTLNFRYAPPRIITVDYPGKGKKQIWYMFYQVYNRSDLPQDFEPVFELVTKDLNTKHVDDMEPLAVKEIRKIEDPTGALNLQTSISISDKKIPVTKTDSVPRYVSGIAVWSDVPERASRTNRFSVYVFGLSNGVVAVETADGGTIVKRKTLRLDFFKPTDEVNPGAGDIQIETNRGLGGEKWDYIASSKRKPSGEAAPKPKEDGKDK